MANLSSNDKRKLEKLFEMGNGYVLDFSNATFADFVEDNINIEIYQEKYGRQGTSKANHLREFWRQESDYTVGKLILDLAEHWRTMQMTNFTEIDEAHQLLFDECVNIGNRLRQNVGVGNVEMIRSYSEDEDFVLLAQTIRTNIENNEPEAAIDRLHTFMMRYVRGLLDKHNLVYGKGDSLNKVFKQYVDFLDQNKLIESEMTKRILKSSISVLDSFNEVRNNKSFAHDNPILNHDESILILDYITSLIKFIETIENSLLACNEEPGTPEDDFLF